MFKFEGDTSHTRKGAPTIGHDLGQAVDIKQIGYPHSINGVALAKLVEDLLLSTGYSHSLNS